MIDHSHKKGIFKDPGMQSEFNENGFVQVPFLNHSQISELHELYREIYPEGVKGFFTTTFSNDVSHREKVNRSIQEICSQRIEEIFENYKILFSSFIVKAPGADSELKMHQDMTLVDESLYAGINIWCPLVDLTESNGAIEVLPGSHRLFNTYRGSSLPDIYDDVVDEVKQLMQPCKLPAGTAIIFDQSIIHYSPPNLSDAERPVINTFVAHKEAQIKICYYDKEKHPGKIEIFEQEDDFLEQFENFGHNIFNRPEIGKSLGLFDYDFPKLSPDDLAATYGYKIPGKQVKPKSWLQKLFSNS